MICGGGFGSHGIIAPKADGEWTLNAPGGRQEGTAVGCQMFALGERTGVSLR